MKAGIDGRLYSQTGVGVYIRNLLFWLQKKDDADIVYYIYLMDKDYKKISFSDKRFVKRRANYPWHSFSEQIGFLRTVNKDNLDLMHFTYFSYPVLYWRPFVATVHDLTPILYKTGRASTKNQLVYHLKHFLFKFIVKTQVSRAKSIITPTNTVKNQLIEYYGKKHGKKIQAFYEGVNYELTNHVDDFKQNSKKPFFIYVGNFYPHKNVESLIDAFSKISKNYQLILIGPKDYFAERIGRHINQLAGNNQIIIDTDFSLGKLIYYYKNAEALIHPSFSEGFGLPIIEAMYFNLPIIASDIEVFRELVGQQYLPFDPNNIEDIKPKIEEFISGKKQFDYKVYLKRYSFQEMTDKVFSLYKKIT